MQHIKIMVESKIKITKDPNALKIASFRTKEGVWADFCSKADEQGLTATDVLKAAMVQFISGEYQPSTRYHDNYTVLADINRPPARIDATVDELAASIKKLIRECNIAGE